MNVIGERYILPQASAFGLSWSMVPGRQGNTRSRSLGRTDMEPPLLDVLPFQGERSLPPSHTPRHPPQV